jgi:hypothetical protein
MEVVYQSDKLIIIDNFFEDLDKQDPNNFYDMKNYRRKYSFPEQHDQFIIDQYDGTDQVNAYGEIAAQKIKELRADFPSNYTVSSGLHEIKHHTDGIGGIPPHSDRGHYCGVTVFVNREWKREWGGWNYTLEEDDIKLNSPTYNRAVIIIAPILHGCTPVWEKDKVRRSMQFFIDDVDAKN